MLLCPFQVKHLYVVSIVAGSDYQSKSDLVKDGNCTQKQCEDKLIKMVVINEITYYTNWPRSTKLIRDQGR